MIVLVELSNNSRVWFALMLFLLVMSECLSFHSKLQRIKSNFSNLSIKEVFSWQFQKRASKSATGSLSLDKIRAAWSLTCSRWAQSINNRNLARIAAFIKYKITDSALLILNLRLLEQMQSTFDLNLYVSYQNSQNLSVSN